MHYLIYHADSPCPPLLKPDELDAVEQEAFSRRGESYLRIRSILKRELARLSGVPAESIRFTYTAHGKPIFDSQPFNMSHSGDLLCLAFHHRDIGVDIEKVRERPGMKTTARRFMCDEQLHAWHERGCPAEDFFACWCAAEAIVKRYGASIWHAPQYPFLYKNGCILPQFPQAPEIKLFTPAPGYQGAVAWQE